MANVFVVTCLFYILLNTNLNIFGSILIFLIIALCQHYFLNLVHIGSHHLLSKNKHINSVLGNVASIIGGVTFADFKTTHFLHHRNVSDDKNDPDHWITTSGNVLTIPFKIFYHDYYFWTRGLWKQNNAWKGYLIDRLMQGLLVLGFYFTGNIVVWEYFWLLPLLLVGFLNGLFLFYFPHHTTRLERNWREVQNKLPHQSLTLLAIDISRIYHEKHHNRIAENRNYFPILAFMQDKLSSTWNNLTIGPISKYTDIKVKSA
ncbi:MAG: fatty acid desaturase [candidate division SR1 bacterium]|nr:fatty acid desaturase [candidate division SR1 bacterium]